MPTLAVLGAGPKGIAIAAKARALATAGLDAPRVVLIDPGPFSGGVPTTLPSPAPPLTPPAPATLTPAAAGALPGCEGFSARYAE